MNALKKILLMALGGIAIILGIVLLAKDTGPYSSYERYGGDAYTGIQHASVDTARSVQRLSEIVQLGLGSILIVGGAALIVTELPSKAAKAGQVRPEAVQPANQPEPPVQPQYPKAAPASNAPETLPDL